MLKKKNWTLTVNDVEKMPHVINELKRLKIRITERFASGGELSVRIELFQLDTILTIDGVDGATYSIDSQRGTNGK